MRSRLGLTLLILGVLTLLAALPMTALGQDDDGWGSEGTTTRETEPLPPPPDVVEPGATAPSAGGDAVAPPTSDRAQPPSLPDVYITTPDSTGWQFLANYHQSVRWVLVGLLLVVAYLFPTLFYPGMLRRWGMSPGGAAALCLVVGGLVTTPGVAALMAKQVFLNALPVPWWRQQETLIPAAIYMAVFLLLGIVAWVTGRPSGRN